MQNYESKHVHLSIILQEFRTRVLGIKVAVSLADPTCFWVDSSYPKYLAQGHKQDDRGGGFELKKTDGLVIMSPLLLY